MALTTAIALLGERLLAVLGSTGKAGLTIKRAQAFALEEGAVINGVITNDAPVRAVLAQLRKQGVQQARLVLDSSLILLKDAAVPALPPKQLLTLVRQELADAVGTYDELIYDYSVLQPATQAGGGIVMCCAVERKFMESYTELFRAADVKLLSVDVSINAVNKLTGLIPELRGKSYILTVLDGNNAVSILYENGRYRFSNRSRLFAPRGTEAFMSELSGKISSLIQFNKAQKSPYPIESAWFCGLTGEEEPLCAQLGAPLAIQAAPLPDYPSVRLPQENGAPCRLSDYLYAAGCLIRK